jgi:hypothetical protein
MLQPDGSDIIFVTGAPGSKWSANAHALAYADTVNISDISADRSYEGEARAAHFGNYFGPGMEFGKRFDQLDALSKDDLLKEFAAPYQEPGGVVLLKSHLFSRHLEYLSRAFPQARFLLVYRPDHACLEWWRQAGGFSISYPDYTWYDNTGNMAEQIALDNTGITDFASEQGARLTRHRSMRPVLRALGLSYSPEHITEVAQTEFERRYGLGGRPADEVEADCHRIARLAQVAVVTPGHGADG